MPASSPSSRRSIGVGIEAARAAASLAFGGTAEAARLERVLFSHAAGGLPLLLARADYFWGNEDAATRTAEPPSVLARRFFYDSMVFDPRGLRFIVDYLGADRIVLGTDFPAMPRAESLARQLDELGLSGDDHERIASANARDFLGAGADAGVVAR
jgi:aminocarboxymuconate-semialdehyde decarboxylase